jgi:hypothetical protein
MLLEHQTQMHNFVTAASYETRRALYYQASMNRALEREADYQSDSTRRRIQSAVDDLVEYLFFVDEFEFTSPVRGNSSFSEVFQRAGIRDSKGRSLRDLDLQTGLLKYPCSFLVYSKSFAALPDEAMRLVRQKMLSVLQGEETSRQFSHLTAEDRGAILEILVETHPLFREASLSATDQSAIIQHVKD